MPAFIEYLIKLSICLAVVYIFYQLFLRRLTFYNWNRWYLLGYAALAFIIPLIDIMPQLQKREIAEATIITWIPPWGYAPETKNFFETLGYWDWTLIVLAIGSLFFLVRFLTRIYSFLLIKNKATLITKHQTLLYQLDENITPFSFGNSIFINHNLHSEEELKEIIRHEFVHVKQKHTIDIIFCELLCITNWFNPFAWLIRRSIKQNLEFIADDKVVQNGFDKKEYQYLLLKVMGNKQFTFTNHFNFSSLKKRIAMMNTLKTAKVHLIKFLFLLPVVAVLVLSFRKEVNATERRAGEQANKESIIENEGIGSFIIRGHEYKSSVKSTDTIPKTKKNKEHVIEFFADSLRDQSDTIIIKGNAGLTIKGIDIVKKPLFIFDGKEIPNSSVNLISPNVIESIHVLKGASGVSTYGDKAMNGVIIIQSKKSGQTGSNLEFRDSLQVAKTLKGKVTGILIQENANKNIDASLSVNKNLEEVIVEGRPMPKKNQESAPSIKVAGSENPLLIVDGQEIAEEEFKKIKAESINEIIIFKDKTATEKYGDKGKNGVVEVKLKEKAKEK